MLYLQETVIVEGNNDCAAVRRAVSALILQTRGLAAIHQDLDLWAPFAAHGGLVILTDPDPWPVRRPIRPTGSHSGRLDRCRLPPAPGPTDGYPGRPNRLRLRRRTCRQARSPAPLYRFGHSHGLGPTPGGLLERLGPSGPASPKAARRYTALRRSCSCNVLFVIKRNSAKISSPTRRS